MFRGWVGRALDLALPPMCGACGLPGDPLCADCRAALIPVPAPRCAGCGHPLPIALDRCAACLGPLLGARQAVLYAGPAPAVIAALKDARRQELASPLAEVVAETVARPPPGSRLIPVPLGAQRLREQGFNHAEVLATELAARWGLPVFEALMRRREGSAQRGAPRRRRMRQVAGAFAMAAGRRAPLRAVMVDDVHTTGATVAACARVLREAGSASVSAVCVARAPDPRLPRPASSRAALESKVPACDTRRQK